MATLQAARTVGSGTPLYLLAARGGLGPPSSGRIEREGHMVRIYVKVERLRHAQSHVGNNVVYGLDDKTIWPLARRMTDADYALVCLVDGGAIAGERGRSREL